MPIICWVPAYQISLQQIHMPLFQLPSVVIYICSTSVIPTYQVQLYIVVQHLFLPTMHDHAACLICCAPIILSKASNMQVSMHKLQNMQWLPSVRKCEI